MPRKCLFYGMFGTFNNSSCVIKNRHFSKNGVQNDVRDIDKLIGIIKTGRILEYTFCDLLCIIKVGISLLLLYFRQEDRTYGCKCVCR